RSASPKRNSISILALTRPSSRSRSTPSSSERTSPTTCAKINAPSSARTKRSTIVSRRCASSAPDALRRLAPHIREPRARRVARSNVGECAEDRRSRSAHRRERRGGVEHPLFVFAQLRQSREDRLFEIVDVWVRHSCRARQERLFHDPKRFRRHHPFFGQHEQQRNGTDVRQRCDDF